MRLRGQDQGPVEKNNISLIRKVLKADRFEVHFLNLEGNTVNVFVTNTKFRSIPQAVGRLASTLQRFTADGIEFANISFHSKGLITATYLVDLNAVTREQFNPSSGNSLNPSIIATDTPYRPPLDNIKNDQ